MNTDTHYKSTLILLCSLVCIHTPAAEPETQKDFDQIIYNWTHTLAEVMQLANKKHYKITNADQAMIKSIDTFLTTLDPHSSFLDPKTYKNMLEMTSGEFFGIGIMMDNTRKTKDRYLTVLDVISDGPSDRAGIKPLDKIVEINKAPLEGMSTDDAAGKLKGERYSKVQVKVMRENSPDLLSFEITRDVIKEQNSLSFYIKDQHIYYLSLNMFTENSIKQMEELLKKAQEKQYRGIIIDLRNNTGGLLNAVIDIASLFLQKNSLVVVTKDKNNKELEKYYTNRDPITNAQVPIFILVNNYTASAAEILAGCLQIHSQNAKNNKTPVFLVGSRTFGKGSVQEIIPVSNNSAIKLTTSLYYLPNDTTIQGIGIEPDFITDKTYPPSEQLLWFTKNYGREQALENYIKPSSTASLDKKSDDTKTKTSSKRWYERAKEMLQTDNQLREAINLINILHTAKTSIPARVQTRAQALTYLKQNYVNNTQLEIEPVKI